MRQLASRAVLLVGAFWVQSRPSDSMRTALTTHADLSDTGLDFAAAVEDTFITLLAGTLFRYAQQP